MKKLLLILFFVISSLYISCEELVLQVPIVETNFCVALHNVIKSSSPDVIELYRHPSYDSRRPVLQGSDQLFNICLNVYENDHRNGLVQLSHGQLHSMILVMTRSADQVVVENNLSEDVLGGCLGILRKRAIVTSADRPCPEGYAVVRYDYDAPLDLNLEPMDVSE